MVLWGYPGAGKSTFARWLRDNKGFTYVETDELGDRVGSPLEEGWRATFERRLAPANFIALVGSQNHSVVVEFGLWATPENINLLAHIDQAGAQVWWFYGNRATAKQAWRTENRISHRLFNDGKWEEVVGLMDTNWGLITKLFGPRMLRTVEQGPVHLPTETIYDSIFG